MKNTIPVDDVWSVRQAVAEQVASVSNYIYVNYDDDKQRAILRVELYDPSYRTHRNRYAVISAKNNLLNVDTILKKAAKLQKTRTEFEATLAAREKAKAEKRKNEREQVLALLQGYEIPNAYFYYDLDSGHFSISLSHLSEKQARSVAMVLLMSSSAVD